MFGGDDSTTERKPAADVPNLLDVPLIDAADVTAAVTWLAADESRFVTGVAPPIDAGFLAR